MKFAKIISYIEGEFVGRVNWIKIEIESEHYKTAIHEQFFPSSVANSAVEKILVVTKMHM